MVTCKKYFCLTHNFIFLNFSLTFSNRLLKGFQWVKPFLKSKDKCRNHLYKIIAQIKFECFPCSLFTFIKCTSSTLDSQNPCKYNLRSGFKTIITSLFNVHKEKVVFIQCPEQILVSTLSSLFFLFGSIMFRSRHREPIGWGIFPCTWTSFYTIVIYIYSQYSSILWGLCVW